MKPMSWAIIFGLTFATFLTLIIVPVYGGLNAARTSGLTRGLITQRRNHDSKRRPARLLVRSVWKLAFDDALDPRPEARQQFVGDGVGLLRDVVESGQVAPQGDGPGLDAGPWRPR